MKGTFAKKVLTPLKICAIVGLAIASFSAKAGYIGNPTRPDTIWVPAHCAHGCYQEGYFLKVMHPECLNCTDLVWVDGMYDRNGNWTPAHYEIKKYVVINHRDTNYVPNDAYYVDGYQGDYRFHPSI